MINKGKWKTDDVIHVRPPSPPRPPPAPPSAGGRPRKVTKPPAAAASAAEGVAARDAGADEADADEADADKADADEADADEEDAGDAEPATSAAAGAGLAAASASKDARGNRLTEVQILQLRRLMHKSRTKGGVVVAMYSVREALDIAVAEPYSMNVSRGTVGNYHKLEKAAVAAGTPTTAENIAAAMKAADDALREKTSVNNAKAKAAALMSGDVDLTTDESRNGVFKLAWLAEAKAATLSAADLPGFGPRLVAAIVRSIHATHKIPDDAPWTPSIRWARDFMTNALRFAPRAVTSKLASLEATTEMASLFELLKNTLALDIVDGVMPRLIVFTDETGIGYMSNDGKRWAKIGSIRVKGELYDLKRQYTATLSFTATGRMLPPQLIYEGKTQRVLPRRLPGTEEWLFNYTSNHWSNQEMKLRLLDSFDKCVALAS